MVRDIRSGNVVGDSIAYSNSGQQVWFSVRTGSRKAKSGWAKIHMLIDIDTRAILKGKITRAPPPTALP